MGRANRYLLERGITSATDANMAPNDRGRIRPRRGGERLRVRVNCMIGWAEVMKQTGEGAIPTPEELQPPQSSGVNWHRLHVGQAKLFSDGAITTRTCWLTEPFEGMAGQTTTAAFPCIRRTNCASISARRTTRAGRSRPMPSATARLTWC